MAGRVGCRVNGKKKNHKNWEIDTSAMGFCSFLQCELTDKSTLPYVIAKLS